MQPNRNGPRLQRADRHDRPDEVLVGSHAAGDAVHDDAEPSLRHDLPQVSNRQFRLRVLQLPFAISPIPDRA